MTAIETYNKEHADVLAKLKTVKLPTDGTATGICWEIGRSLKVTGPTVRNYLSGGVKDGFLAVAIYNEFKRLKMVKNIKPKT